MAFLRNHEHYFGVRAGKIVVESGLTFVTRSNQLASLVVDLMPAQSITD